MTARVLTPAESRHLDDRIELSRFASESVAGGPVIDARDFIRVPCVTDIDYGLPVVPTPERFTPGSRRP